MTDASEDELGQRYCEGYRDGSRGAWPAKQVDDLRPWPGLFAVIYPRLVETARQKGYALAIQGSLARDFDLVAVPWTEEAVEPFALAEALRERVGGFGHNGWPAPRARPHGRLCWSIHLGGGPYIDLSVTPFLPASRSPIEAAAAG